MLSALAQQTRFKGLVKCCKFACAEALLFCSGLLSAFNSAVVFAPLTLYRGCVSQLSFLGKMPVCVTGAAPPPCPPSGGSAVPSLRLSPPPADSALPQPGVHGGDSNQDSRRDWCLLSPLTAVASFLIHKCKETGAKSFCPPSFLRATARVSPETPPHNVLSPPERYFCISWHLCKDLIYLFIFPSSLLHYSWGLGLGSNEWSHP